MIDIKYMKKIVLKLNERSVDEMKKYIQYKYYYFFFEFFSIKKFIYIQ
jgi:hypothetical protein